MGETESRSGTVTVSSYKKFIKVRVIYDMFTNFSNPDSGNSFCKAQNYIQLLFPQVMASTYIRHSGSFPDASNEDRNSTCWPIFQSDYWSWKQVSMFCKSSRFVNDMWQFSTHTYVFSFFAYCFTGSRTVFSIHKFICLKMIYESFVITGINWKHGSFMFLDHWY